MLSLGTPGIPIDVSPAKYKLEYNFIRGDILGCSFPHSILSLLVLLLPTASCPAQHTSQTHPAFSMQLSLLLTTVLTAVAVSAQGTGNISPCIQQCSQQAATAAGCTNMTQTSCTCTSQTFSNSAMQCLQTNCTPADQQAAMGLQAALCAPYTNTKPVSSVAYAGMTSTASTVAPTSSAAASSAPSASATKSSNAGSAVKVGYGSIFAVAVGAAGMLA